MVRTAFRLVLALFMITAGVLHFVVDHLFAQIVPPFLPGAYPIVWISGVFEILLGLLLLVPRYRRLASLGLVALFVAVFPANIYMAVANVQIQGLPAGMQQPSELALWLRLPLQFALMAWAYWAGRDGRPRQALREMPEPRTAVS
jgi:uncharacterized membrane protein